MTLLNSHKASVLLLFHLFAPPFETAQIFVQVDNEKNKGERRIKGASGKVRSVCCAIDLTPQLKALEFREKFIFCVKTATEPFKIGYYDELDDLALCRV